MGGFTFFGIRGMGLAAQKLDPFTNVKVVGSNPDSYFNVILDEKKSISIYSKLDRTIWFKS